MAAPRPHLARAPIAEAIWDIRVAPAQGATIETIQSLARGLAEQYPNQSPIVQFEAALFRDGSGAHGSSSRESINGVLLRTDHGTVGQIRLDGVTLSKLRPYTTWEELAAEATCLWDAYAAALQPRAVLRAGLRFINDMVLPASPLDAYLAAPPNIPPGISQITKEFLSRVVIWDQQRLASAIITQALGPPADADRMRILLDIDVYSDGSAPAAPSRLLPLMGRLREMKNEIFFASITAAAVEHFT
ncbi:MAG: TIGR04255 family protein [Terriglobales bacterium]